MALTASPARRLRRAVGFVRAVVRTFQSTHVPFLAGSIAYAAFVSLLPILVLAVLVASAIGGERVAGLVLQATERYLSPAGQDLIVDALRRATARTGLSVLSVVVLGWSVMRLFRGLDLAFSLLYGTEGETDFVGQVVDGLVVLVAITVGVAGMVAVIAVFSLLPAVPFNRFVDKVLVLAFVAVALLPVYYVFPDTRLSLGEVLPGALVAALGWTVLAGGFQLYVSVSRTAQLYGIVGGLILLVTLLYFGALALLLGATVNVVLAGGGATARSAVA